MIERAEGISCVQPGREIAPSTQNKDQMKLGSELTENKLKENKLSADELKKKLEEDIEDINNIVETLEESISFKLHDDTNRLMVQVIDIKSREVVKEMPSEELLDLAAKIHKMVGLLIDEKV